MKRRLFTFALAALTIGLLGSCSKINERIDGLDNRVYDLENEKIASIEQQIATINQSIADLETIRTNIQNLKNAQEAQGQDITALKAADITLEGKINDLKAYVNTELAKYATTEWANATFATLKQLNTTNTELGALKETVGKLGETFDGKLSDLKTELTNSINTAVSNLETRISTLEDRVSAIEAMIQSVTIVPAYTDGSVEAKGGILYLDIIVKPAVAVANLTTDSLKVLVNEANKVQTKAVSLDTVAIEALKADPTKGTVMARANILSKLPAPDGKALTVAVNVKNGISDFITEFYPVTLSTESNVTITDETEATKVSIETDEDFPESVMGNIGVAEGFKDTKPTSVSIPMPSLKVGGIGTVTFNEKATAKIKANAEGSTNVFFKVEDVTTTKPVENADVVLEVTMKTVDENGKEVFNEKNAEGEVTIQIPMDENVAYVNSVTLVNDAGESIEGGVVPGSEEIENGILTFKVNHFSKYAVDYVTKTDFVAVTGVSIEPVSVTLQVGDTLRLVANITPEDATNKKVAWSSSDTTKVKVDDTGKITAVAFGKATITVTTVDGNKTADCTVKVYETKTMADILKTTTGIPESVNMTPPANAWVNSTNPDCKAFVGKDGEAKLFVILKEGQPSASLKLRMDDDFARIDDNTYQRIEPSVGTFTIKMAEGKFTSYEFTAASGSAYEQFNGTYSAPVSKEYVEIAAKYDGSTVSTLRWYRQSLAITDSGKKAWKGGSGSAVKVPGTGEDVVVGDYFQWGTYAGFYGSGAGTDKGLLPYTSFTSTGCGDGSNAFTFKSGKQFNEENAPYWSGSAYTKYNATDTKTELDASDDVASIILGGTWRMPTSAEIVAMKAATYWKWDATDKGYYVFNPMEGDAGKINDETSNTYENADALLFFPAVGLGYEGTLYSDDNSIAYYWSRTLYSNSAHAYAMYIDKSEIHPDEDEITARGFGFAIRPVQNPAATYVAVTGVSLDVTAKEIVVGGNVQLNVTVVPATATQNGVYWTSSAPTVATVDAAGKVTAVAAGTATITATTVDGSKTATCVVTVIPFVDLGVKTATGKPLYWAECNLGASNPEDPGNYYVWGATALMYSAVDYTKKAGAFTFVKANPYGNNYKNTWDENKGFAWNNTPFTDGVYNNSNNKKVFTKYTTSNDYAKSGAPDNLTTLNHEDDAATAKNASWRMPTIDDFKSLVANCVLVWTSDYNSTSKAGYIVYKAKNEADKGKAKTNSTWQMWDAANSKYITNTGSEPTGYSTSDIHIFLPAAGSGSGANLNNYNTGGVYWSSSLATSDDLAFGLVFMAGGIQINEGQRQYGYSIRPVTD